MLVAGLVLFITLVLLSFLFSMIWPPDSPWSPWWRTNKKVAREMVKLAGISSKDLIYDLGCGDGTLLITAAKTNHAKGVGIDIDPSRVFIARLRVILNRLNGQVIIKRGNLFNENISEATIVVVYLIPQTLRRLETKFLHELRPGTRVISYVYPIDYLPRIGRDDKNQITVYQIPKKSNSSKKKD